MAAITNAVFKASTTALYADNLSGQISAADIRTQMDNIADSVPFKVIGRTAPPTVNDDSANTSSNGIMTISDIWVDEVNNNAYVCVDNTPTAAIWKNLTFAAPTSKLAFATITEAVNSALATTADIITTGGFSTYGDGGHGIYKKSGSQPTHAGKFQLALTGTWYELITSEPEPQQVGAKGDNATDDSTALNNWAQLLRTTNRAGKIPGGDYFCGNTTLYFGGITFVGAGSALNNRWPTVQTNFVSNANPIIMMAKDAATATTFQGQDWSKFTVSYAGGIVAPIETWFKLSYSGQIGIALGRSLHFIQATTDEEPETSIAGGVGSIRLRDFTIQDVGGIGLYCYKLWGDSLVSDGILRCCGGLAARDYDNPGILDGNSMGGGLFVDSLTVDTVFQRIHAFGTGYGPDAFGNPKSILNDVTLDHWGTAFHVGRDKATTDPLNRIFDSSNNIHFQNCHSEGYNEAFFGFSTKWGTVTDFNSNGSNGLYGGVTFGYAAMTPNNCRWQATRLRVGSAKYIRVCNGQQITIGELINSTPGVLTPIQYWVPTAFEILGCVDGETTPAESGFSISPEPDITTAPGGTGLESAIYSPYAKTGVIPVSPFDNSLPSFNNGTGGTALVGWVATGAGTNTVNANGSIISLVGSAIDSGRTATYTVTGITAGELYTFQVYERFASGFGGANVTVRLKNNAGTVFFSRSLGEGLKDPGLYRIRFNFVAPVGGEIRVELGMFSTVPAEFIAPTLNLGLAGSFSRTVPTRWMALNGLFATT
jgi:hypothetical protein